MGTVFDAIERDFTQTEILKVSAGAGAFMLGEKIYQGVDENSSTAAAEVASWNATQNQLGIFNKVGTFVNSENITGVISLTTRTISSQDDQDSPNLSHSDNKVFETEGDNILDFSEIDPWAEGDL